MALNIKRGKIARAQKTAIYGPEGIGKSTLASRFPEPLFIDTEGGTDHIDVARVDPAPKTWEELLNVVKEVIADPKVCKTLVIDTMDWAEQLIIEYVFRTRGMKSIEDALGHSRHHVTVTLPYSMGGMVDTLHSGAQVLNVDYTGEGIVVEAILDHILYGKLKEYVTKEH